MPAHVIVGAQWGDEGKGKVVDLYTEHADVVVRFQGGNNAGHTLVTMRDGVRQKNVLHLIPSGILHEGKRCVIASGVVLDPWICLEEIDTLKARGYLAEDDQLTISRDVTLILPYHKALDLARERARGDDKIGTTGRGIGPAYEDRVARRAVMLRDLADEATLRAKLDVVLPEKNLLLDQLAGERFELDEVVEELMKVGRRLLPHAADTSRLIHDALQGGEQVLFEGAQGTLLDVGFGTYPFVTSSHTIAGGASVGAGMAPSAIDQVIGIAKAYTTRVGRGAFPTELDDETGETMRDIGQEYGATTGRPRRCGWLDIAALRYATRLNGFTGIALTKLDVLSPFETIKIGVGYRDSEGTHYDEPPMDHARLSALSPIYEELEGWGGELREARAFDELPAQARAYVARIEELLGVPIVLVSVGPARSETIVVTRPFE